ncbi:MAG TPA: hypothetical protein VGP07_16630, partial [Polyangia bacterium]
MRSTCLTVAARVAVAALVLGVVASCGNSGQPTAQGLDGGGEPDSGKGGADPAGSGGAAGSGDGRVSSGSGGSGGVASGGGGVSAGASGGVAGDAGTAGTGSGGRGGSAAGGAGGTDGPTRVTLGTCPATQVTGQPVTAKAPVVLAAKLTSTDPTDFDRLSISATSATDTAYVAFTSSAHVAEIAPAGVSVESTGVCGAVVALLLDGHDAPTLFASTEDPITSAVYPRFYSVWARGQPAWSPDLVVKAEVNPIGYGGVDYVGQGAVIGAAGQPRALVYDEAKAALTVYDRSAQGSWTQGVSVAQDPQVYVYPFRGTYYYSFAALDALGRLRVVYTFLDASSRYHFNEWTDGNTLVDFRTDATYNVGMVAAGLSGLLGIERFTDDGIVLTTSDGSTVAADHLVPGTTQVGSDACWVNSPTCMPVVCDTQGVSISTVALASTSDGAFWLAYRYVRDHTEWSALSSVTSLNYCWQ